MYLPHTRGTDTVVTMACFGGVRKRLAESEMCHTTAIGNGSTTCVRFCTLPTPQASSDIYRPILPGLPDDVAKFCLALIPRCYLPAMGTVSKRWRSFIQSKEFISVRKEAGKLEEWLFVLSCNKEGRGSHWDVFGCSGDKKQTVPTMPGPDIAGFGIVILDGNLLVMAGYSVDSETKSASSDVYQYDSRLNRWSKLAKMNVARYDFACAEVDGLIYAVGGYGPNGDILASVEVYEPKRNKWTLIETLRRPRWAGFACSLEGKLYVMGGRSSFTIGNSRFVDVYDPEYNSWFEMKNGCVMVTAHAVLSKRLFCVEWKNQRMLAIFNPVDHSWQKVAVPLTGSSAIQVRLGIFDGKLLLFSLEEDPEYQTLLYDPDAPPGSEWKTSPIKPSGACLFSVTIKA